MGVTALHRHCMVMEFSPETGKIHKIRAYV